MRESVRGVLYTGIVISAVVIGASGGFLLGYIVGIQDDDPWLSPVEWGVIFSVVGAGAGLAVALISAFVCEFVGWLRRR